MPSTHGRRLESVLNGTWTTSTELVGELGLVVVAVRKECKPLAPDQKALVKECLRQVRKAWPGFGLFSWIPFKVAPRRHSTFETEIAPGRTHRRPRLKAGATTGRARMLS